MNETPFEDVILDAQGFSLPDLKWRELVFTGAMRPDGEVWVRDASRPMTPFAVPDLLPEGVRFAVVRRDGRAHLKRT